MNGRLGAITVTPDQMEALNPIFILLLIPVFQFLIYPLFNKCHILQRPLQRMVVGMGISGLAFILAGIVELKISAEAGVLSPGQSKIVIINSIQSPIEVESSDFYITLNESQKVTEVVITNSSVIVVSNMYGKRVIVTLFRLFDVVSGADIARFSLDSKIIAENLKFLDVSTVSTVASGRALTYSIILEQNASIRDRTNVVNFCIHALWPVLLPHQGTLPEFNRNEVYAIIIRNVSGSQHHDISVASVIVDKPNTVSLFLQVPMYIVISIGDVIMSIHGLQFAYSQAPQSMKTICLAIWYMTIAFGNLIVVIVAESKLFDDQAIAFFSFAVTVEIVTIVFGTMAYFYKDIKPTTSDATMDEFKPLVDSTNKTDVINDSKM